jgi:hypothetical protein
MSILIAALAALALLASSPSASSKATGVTAPIQGPVVYDAVIPIGL